MRRAPAASARLAELVHGSLCPGHDDLARAVVVRGPDSVDLRTELLDDGVVETEDRGHGAVAHAGRLVHRQAAFANQGDRLGDVERARRRQRRELADRVADDEVGVQPSHVQRREDGEARRDERRLLDVRADELVERRLEAQALEIEPGGLAPFAKDLHRLGHRFGDLATHAHLERALSGEAECDLHEPTFPFAVHSIKAEPQVRPAPMPVISTSSPGFNRPSASASASASGIEPDDVLP